ncbi:MAG: hypothetical protein MJ245_00490 [Clostridia bacterium]|nr:hypothetical protein [Clostridia bacterium]
MEEFKEYNDWCLAKGYKPNDTNALKEYNQIKRATLLQMKMKLYGDNNLNSLADELGIVRQTLSKKISGEAVFTLQEAEKLKRRYNLTEKEYHEIFKKEIYQDEYTGSSEVIK